MRSEERKNTWPRVEIDEESTVAENEVGIKHDKGKMRFSLLPLPFVKAVCSVMEYGAEKYGEGNWKRGMAWSRLYDACHRHLHAFWDTNESDKDEESGLSHLAHAAACLVMLFMFSWWGTGDDDR